MYRSGMVPIVLILAGCAATPYQVTDTRGYGYQEAQLAADVYDVMFVGNTATSPQQVQDFALLRAAELGTSQGYAYLSVTNTKAGNIMLAPMRSTGGDYAGAMQPTAGRQGSGMMGGSMGGGSYADRGGNLTNLIGTGPSGDPARACVLTVHFYRQAEAAAVHPPEDIQALLAKLRGEYGVAPGGP